VGGGLRRCFLGEAGPRVYRPFGHANTTLVDEVYGHRGDVKHRSEVVEYRATQHRAKLKRHLTLLKSA
jgi:hypothetical protein